MGTRNQQGSGSLTWLLVGAVSLVLVVKVQPYPGYIERLYPSILQYLQSQQQQHHHGEGQDKPLFHRPNEDNMRDEEDFGFSRIYAYDTLKSDQAEESNRNLQLILRSIRPVVGGTYPSDRVLPLDNLDDLGLTDNDDGRAAAAAEEEAARQIASDNSLAQLSFAKHKQKRVMCHFKICNMGRRRRARHSSPLQGWLS